MHIPDERYAATHNVRYDEPMKTPTPQQAIALLLSSGCTQASIAKAASVNQSTICRILRGSQQNIHHDTALRILEVHRLTLGEPTAPVA